MAPELEARSDTAANPDTRRCSTIRSLGAERVQAALIFRRALCKQLHAKCLPRARRPASSSVS
eukprot:6411650-Alexandrium_andersonii.AAC.1